MAYTYSIIDSDAVSILQLQKNMKKFLDFQCLGWAKSSSGGLNYILKNLPDVVFINLNDKAHDHFHMITSLHQYLDNMPIIIGISNTTKFAYEAIKNNFFDYILMPFNEFEIRKTVLKIRKQSLLNNEPQFICLKSYSDFQYLDTSEILYLRADNNATDFIMKNGKTISAFKTLKSFENILPKNFVRVHQSYIVNSDHIARVNYGKGICAFKTGKEELPFSKSYKNNIQELKIVLAKKAISAVQ